MEIQYSALILYVEIFVFTILGTVSLKRNKRSYINQYYAVFFYCISLMALVTLINKMEFIIVNPIIFVPLVTLTGILTLIPFFLFTAGFIVIRVGESLYREERYNLKLSIIIIITTVIIIWVSDPVIYLDTYSERFFILSITFVYLFSTITLFLYILGIIVLFPSFFTMNNSQKYQMGLFCIAFLFFWIGATMINFSNLGPDHFFLYKYATYFSLLGVISISISFFMRDLKPYLARNPTNNNKHK